MITGKKINSVSHNMAMQNIWGTRLNLCSQCGAVIYKNKWRLAGYESTEEPPCLENMDVKFNDWRSRALEIKDGEI